MPSTPATIQLSLVSHTNVGKTTLARTLLRRDIGEVRDQAHVTDLAEAQRLIDTPQGDVLLLWDTPGFGDSARLLKRLRKSENPLGWLLSPWLLTLVNAAPAVQAEALPYLRTMFLGSIGMLMFFMLGGALTGLVGGCLAVQAMKRRTAWR